jgi:hypothetical protein
VSRTHARSARDGSAPPLVLLVDDGELQEVRALLQQLGVPWTDAPSLTSPEAPESVSLLVTSARHALSRAHRRCCAGLHLVVYDDPSRTLRKVLERSGCDLVMRRPMNSHAFRLLVAQALYEGPERRRGRRVVLAEPVKIRDGGRVRAATLVQLSLRGCGIVADYEAELGGPLEVVFPKELTAGKALQVGGPVLAVRAAEGEAGRFHVAIAFRLMEIEDRRLVNTIMERLGGGAELRARPPARKVVPAVDQKDRRRAPRKAFSRRVLAGGAGISHVLIGRDLSAGGMRVAPDPSLRVGATLMLALHGRPGLPAVVVQAVVARSDGTDGLVLRFDALRPAAAERLAALVESLPSLPDKGSGATRATPGVVVSEVLERRKS